MATHNELGKEGEAKAKLYLEEKGYEILALNWRYKSVEIDIIALLNATLVIVEVKTRTSIDFGLPQDFVTRKKIQNLLQATNAFMKTHSSDQEVRFDIIAVYKNKNQWEIEHLEDAFYYF